MELLEDGMNIMQAWKMLNDPDVVGHLNTEEYYQLCLDAGYSKEASEKAAASWGLKRLRKDLPV
jgi:hypothetical protein